MKEKELRIRKPKHKKIKNKSTKKIEIKLIEQTLRHDCL